MFEENFDISLKKLKQKQIIIILGLTIKKSHQTKHKMLTYILISNFLKQFRNFPKKTHQDHYFL